MTTAKAVSLSDVTAHITPTSVTSPITSSAKVTMLSTKATASEPDVAFPAVLKGSQKQRVPPPVPPRGSPKARRGGGTSQSSIDTKGDYPNLNISVNDIQPLTPFTSSDDDFCFYGHDFKFKAPDACRIVPSVSDQSIKITKLVASNSFLDYVEEAESITERVYPGKDLIAQTTMMAKFNVDKLVREHLDSGDYDDTSLTESSSEEKIVIEVSEIVDDRIEYKGRQSKSPSQFIKGVVNQIGDKLSIISPSELSTDRFSVHNVRSSDLISAAKTLKKTPTSNDKSKEKDVEKEQEKNGSKPGIISGITKKLNFNQSKRDKNQAQESNKIKPKIEIRTYIEGKSKGGMTKDEVICHKKAKTKIDMFQKHIWKVQSDSENSSRRSSFSSQDSKKSETFKIEKHAVKETKKIFEPIEYTHGSLSSIDKKNFILKTTAINPVVSKTISGNVHDKIKKFSGETKEPMKIPRQKKKASFKKRSEKKKIFKMRKDIEEIL